MFSPRGFLDFCERTGRFVVFAAAVARALPGAVMRPRELARQSARIGLGTLPLVAAAGISVGVVGWLQARTLLADFGSEAQLPGIVAVFVVLGLGPVLTALVMAGQVGARIGAELGSMRITEQVDALESMGLSQIRFLAAERVLACMLMLPLLTVMLDYLALAASFGAESTGGTLSVQQYAAGSLDFLTLVRAVPATASSVLFGFLIGTMACFFGLHAGEGTEGVGRASTYSVVGAMFGVLVANVLWVRITELVLGGMSL